MERDVEAEGRGVLLCAAVVDRAGDVYNIQLHRPGSQKVDGDGRSTCPEEDDDGGSSSMILENVCLEAKASKQDSQSMSQLIEYQQSDKEPYPRFYPLTGSIHHAIYPFAI